MVKLKSSGAGHAVSVYLNARAIAFLKYEIEYEHKSSRDLTVARLIAKCVDYVIDKARAVYFMLRALDHFFRFF